MNKKRFLRLLKWYGIAIVMLLGLVMGFSRMNSKQTLLLFVKLKQYEEQIRHGNVKTLLSQKPNLANRFDHWHQAFRLTREAPIAGWGPGGFCRNLENMYRKKGQYYGNFDNANNYYLNESSESGIIGLSLVLFFTLFPLYMVLCVKKRITANEELWAVSICFSAVATMLVLFITGPHVVEPEVAWMTAVYLGYLFSTAVRYGYNFSPVNKKLWAVVWAVVSIAFIWGTYDNAFGKNGYTLRRQAGWWTLKNDYGYYPWESINNQKMRWTMKESLTQIFASHNLLRLKVTAHQYNIGDSGLKFDMYVNDSHVVEHHFFSTENKMFLVCMPDIAGKQITVRTVVDKTFCPKRIGINNDGRELGVMISEVEFVPGRIPEDGIGFYAWETWKSQIPAEWPHEKPFRVRWTSLQASMNYRPDEWSHIFIKSKIPDSAEKPVTIELINDTGVFRKDLLRDAGWKMLNLSSEELKGTRVLTFRVSRTWNPRLAGISQDDRDLGVAVAIAE